MAHQEPPSTGGANSRQVGGDHYGPGGGMQHWDVVAFFDLDYFQGQITKYVFRFRYKNGVEDLKKARHFLDKLIELEEAKEAAVEEAIDPDEEMTGHSREEVDKEMDFSPL